MSSLTPVVPETVSLNESEPLGLVFLFLACMGSLHILETSPYQIQGCNLFSHILQVVLQSFDVFLCGAEAFQSDIVPSGCLVLFSGFWCHICEITDKNDVIKLSLYVLVQKSYSFRSYIQLFNILDKRTYILFQPLRSRKFFI